LTNKLLYQVGLDKFLWYLFCGLLVQ